MSFLFIYLSDLIIQFRNAYYLRNDIELLSYMYRLYEKYSVDLGLNIIVKILTINSEKNYLVYLD